MKNTTLFEKSVNLIAGSEKFAECKQFIQHGTVTVYEHSIAVAALSFTIGELFRNVDLESLVRAAVLHDFFLYDWHVPENMWSLHGWTHPVTAAENARRFFGISDKEYSLIRTHMWPYTLLHPPQYPEGWIICLSDKIVSAQETLFRQKWRRRVYKPK
ncbi:MAG: HD domain-containing protein [Treponema sp.]|jgi:uncharacterized protein|nr:HD domain-containing protein [Treponema sp.]